MQQNYILISGFIIFKAVTLKDVLQPTTVSKMKKFYKVTLLVPTATHANMKTNSSKANPTLKFPSSRRYLQKLHEAKNYWLDNSDHTRTLPQFASGSLCFLSLGKPLHLFWAMFIANIQMWISITFILLFLT